MPGSVLTHGRTRLRAERNTAIPPRADLGFEVVG
jgi:hypothetical protein